MRIRIKESIKTRKDETKRNHIVKSLMFSLKSPEAPHGAWKSFTEILRIIKNISKRIEFDHGKNTFFAL
jgi:hypothetical protein